jgi:hypothetical protein
MVPIIIVINEQLVKVYCGYLFRFVGMNLDSFLCGLEEVGNWLQIIFG